MADPSSKKSNLIEALNEASRHLSTWTVMFHSAIAERIGLNITDHKCLDILYSQGPMTAGQLADLTGLTTGAVTGVIDRLEHAGYVRRARDASDRRRVIVQPMVEKAAEDLGPLFGHFTERYVPRLEKYREDELRLVLRFVEDSIQSVREEIDWLRQKEKIR
jgi:DNA-binding MarR family transcriptional regulator